MACKQKIIHLKSEYDEKETNILEKKIVYL